MQPLHGRNGVLLDSFVHGQTAITKSKSSIRLDLLDADVAADVGVSEKRLSCLSELGIPRRSYLTVVKERTKRDDLNSAKQDGTS